jgi:hypothetical protein
MISEPNRMQTVAGSTASTEVGGSREKEALYRATDRLSPGNAVVFVGPTVVVATG